MTLGTLIRSKSISGYVTIHVIDGSDDGDWIESFFDEDGANLGSPIGRVYYPYKVVSLWAMQSYRGCASCLRIDIKE